MTSDPLAELLRQLKAANYQFVAVTPATHATVLARPPPASITLRDIFGWNRPFGIQDIAPSLLELLRTADAVELSEGKLRSRVRVASVNSHLFLHGAFPTEAGDSVFFGPDTYRFVRFIQQRILRLDHAGWLVDMGAGSGAGGIMAATAHRFSRVTLVDVNKAALRLARSNAAAAGIAVETLAGKLVPRGAGVVIANPPYMMDSAARIYRHGGNLLGAAVSLEWVSRALAAVPPRGTILLYTGAAYVDGQAPLILGLQRLCAGANATLELAEIDPDLFGEELAGRFYQDVERIAAVGAVITAAS